MQIPPKLSEIDVRLLGNLNRNPVFLTQNLPPDSRSEIQFHLFGRFLLKTAWVEFTVFFVGW